MMHRRVMLSEHHVSAAVEDLEFAGHGARRPA
jgi:hypothetical protein